MSRNDWLLCAMLPQSDHNVSRRSEGEATESRGRCRVVAGETAKGAVGEAVVKKRMPLLSSVVSGNHCDDSGQLNGITSFSEMDFVRWAYSDAVGNVSSGFRWRLPPWCHAACQLIATEF